MKVAVLMGGTTGERLVSIASGAQVTWALRELGHEVVCVDTAFGLLSKTEEDELFQLVAGESPPDPATLPVIDRMVELIVTEDRLRTADVIFNALHGGAGEDGTLAAILELEGLRHTGCSQLSSALAMDKASAKIMFRHAGILTPDWALFTQPVDHLPDGLEYPIIVKPNHGGSTIGVSLVRAQSELRAAAELALTHDVEGMLEQYIPGDEFVIGVLGDTALGIGQIRLKEAELFDYRSKYHKGAADELFPAPIDAQLRRQLEMLAVSAHRALKLNAYSRSDFLRDQDGRIWCIEVNTLPGLTANSLLPQSAAAVGISFRSLCEEICDLAVSADSGNSRTRRQPFGDQASNPTRHT